MISEFPILNPESILTEKDFSPIFWEEKNPHQDQERIHQFSIENI